MVAQFLQLMFHRARVYRIVLTPKSTENDNLRRKFAPSLLPFLDDVDISSATTPAPLKILSVFVYNQTDGAYISLILNLDLNCGIE